MSFGDREIVLLLFWRIRENSREQIRERNLQGFSQTKNLFVRHVANLAFDRGDDVA
jgi:hypothetical protein